MQTWLSALIAAGAAILSASLTTSFAMWMAQRARDERRRQELQAVLAAHCYALERLTVEIGQLPPTPGPLLASLTTAVERASMFNWMIGQTSRHTVGRPAMRAIDALMASAARLTLVAPPDILRASEPIAELLSRFEQRDAQWDEEFAQARMQLIAAARTALEPRRSRRALRHRRRQ